MAVVWAGEHAASGHPVAVKVLSVPDQRRHAFQAAFHTEVLAVAALSHPNIVRVLDHGVIPQDIADQCGGALEAGAPYLVMDRADASVQMRLGLMTWPRVLDLLLGLLEGLAHAHARGIVHRDVKPSNLLLGRGDGRLVLADFGLTHVTGLHRVAEGELASAGTPGFMSPEQIQGKWRDFGPWTDLYATGCAAWAMVTGRPPFKRARSREVLAAQLYQPAPTLEPRFPVPGGLETWLRRLLAKHPSARFQRAADARQALAGLPLARALQAPDPNVAEDAPTVVVDLSTADLAGPRPALAADKGSPGPSTLKLPLSWRLPSDTHAPRLLKGAGLELCRHRQVPFVAREGHRDQLWSDLAQVHRTGRVRVHLLHGPSGVGKSRLARWHCERAHETGGAQVLTAVHGPEAGPTAGLRAALIRDLGGIGLTGLALVDRIRAELERLGGQGPMDEARALAALIEGESDAARIRFSSPEERYLLLERHLHRLCRLRPVVLWIDDAQWGLDALGFVEHLLRRDAPAQPLQILLTIQDEALATRPAALEIVAGLGRQDAVSRVHLGPLGRAERQELVRSLLPLTPGLAQRVEDRTQGNPLFAVQLVRDWSTRGLLEVSDQGFRLAPGAPQRLPDELAGVWDEQVSHLLSTRPRGDHKALEAAAVLGTEVLATEWQALCQRLGCVPSPGLVQELSSRLLIRARPHGGFAFAHGMLREAIEARARRRRRHGDLHSECAAMLAERDDLDAAQRRVHHLQAAGRTAEALPALLAVVEARRNRSELRQARSLLGSVESALEALQLPPGHEHRARLAVWRADLAAWDPGEDSTLSRLDALRAQAIAHDWVLAQARERALRGREVYRRGGLKEAMDLYLQAGVLFERAGDLPGASQNHVNLCQLTKFLGRLDEAAEHAQRALDLARQAGDSYQVAAALHMLSTVAWKNDDAAGCAAWAAEGLAVCEEHGFRANAAKCRTQLGEAARQRGELDAARSHYKAARALFLALERPLYVFVARMNLVMIALSQQDYTEGLAILSAARSQRGVDPGHVLMSAVELGLALCEGALGNWAAWDRHLPVACAGLARSGFVDKDMAWLAQLAAQVAQSAGHDVRAAAARDLAARQLETLGRLEELAALRATESAG